MNWKYQLDAKGYLYSSKSKYLKLVPDQYNNTTRIGNNTTKITCLKPMNLGCTVNSMLIQLQKWITWPWRRKKKIWKDIWATPTGHNSNAAWLKVVKNKWKYLERHLSLLWGCETSILVQETVKISWKDCYWT